MAKAAATQNVEGEKVGILNQLFKRIKAWNTIAYHFIQWGLVGLLAYAVFVR